MVFKADYFLCIQQTFVLDEPTLWPRNVFLGAFVELRKENNELRHVCLSVHPSAWNNPAVTERIFVILYI